jgi:hypothetical protein
MYHDQSIIFPGKTLSRLIKMFSSKFQVNRLVGFCCIGLIKIQQGFLNLWSSLDPVLPGRVTSLKASDLMAPGVIASE